MASSKMQGLTHSTSLTKDLHKVLIRFQALEPRLAWKVCCVKYSKLGVYLPPL